MNAIENIFDYFYQETGIVYNEKKEIIANKIQRLAKQNGYEDLFEYERAIKSNKELFQNLINRLSINETYFFREPRAFDILIEKIDTSRFNKILTIPSSTGEETYTIAMYLDEHKIKNYEILGCDIDSQVIEFAQKGIYKSNSLRKIDKTEEQRYLHPVGDDFQINHILKSKVEFKKQNIFEGNSSNLGQFDFIFCRNLFIYFDTESKIRAEKILYSLLKQNGILFMGHADYPENRVGLDKVFGNGMYYYQKTI